MSNMSMTTPKVSIIILNWNRLKDTSECLLSLRELDYPAYDIIVVDNASSDGSADELERSFPYITLIRNAKNLGFAEGNNAGIARAFANGAEYVWLLNNDTVVEKSTLSELMRTMRSDPRMGMVSPVIYDHSDRSKIQFCGSIADKRRFILEPLKTIEKLGAANTKDMVLWATALLVGKDVINKVGGLDNKFFAYFEDIDLSLRAAESGYRLAVSVTAKVYHKNEYTVPGSQPLHYYFYRGRNKVFLWWDRAAVSGKIRFLGKYLKVSFKFINGNMRNGRHEIADAYMDGMYCALRGVRGSYMERRPMPGAARAVIKTLCCKS